VQYDQSWAERAACHSYPQSLFFKDPGSRDEPWAWATGRRVCAGCPVRRECLVYALSMERASAIELGVATMIRSDWAPNPRKEHDDTCPPGCTKTRHWKRASNKVFLETKPFTASFTPPVGIWGGFLPHERHAKRIKHAALNDEGECIIPQCRGCKPVDEWADELLEAS